MQVVAERIIHLMVMQGVLPLLALMQLEMVAVAVDTEIVGILMVVLVELQLVEISILQVVMEIMVKITL